MAAMKIPQLTHAHNLLHFLHRLVRSLTRNYGLNFNMQFSLSSVYAQAMFIELSALTMKNIILNNKIIILDTVKNWQQILKVT